MRIGTAVKIITQERAFELAKSHAQGSANETGRDVYVVPCQRKPGALAPVDWSAWFFCSTNCSNGKIAWDIVHPVKAS